MKLKWFNRYSAIICSLCISLLMPLAAGLVTEADTNPPSGTPATVSDDALPTVQIGNPSDPASDGTPIGWAQVVVGNTVYVTGDFTTARPAGVALGGAGTVTRNHLLAYNVTTGVLDPSFNISLNGVGRALAVSPDGSRLYVGGSFTTANGATHNRIVAIDLATKSVISSFTGGLANGTVKALAATNTAVYAGGAFSQANGGVARSRMAAFTSGGSLMNWNPTPNGNVAAMVVSPTEPYLVFGGSFSTVNGSPYHSIGAVSLTTGAPVTWASQSSTYGIRNEDPTNSSLSITSMAANSTTIFLSGMNSKNGSLPAALEGRAAINPSTGAIIWVNNCYGDTYSVFPIGQVLYSVGHAHDCSAIGAFPQALPDAWHHALAETTYATGTNGTSPYAPTRTSFKGTPDSTQLDWYPDLALGPYLNQAAWSVSGNSSYVTLAGEFPKVNGVAQQGLVRFAVSSLAPNKAGPRAFSAPGVLGHKVGSDGKASVSINTTWDPDNAVLTYKLYRDGGATPIYTFTADTRFWSLSSRIFTDSGLVPGSIHTYRLTATDPFGNSVSTGWVPTSTKKVANDYNGDGIADPVTFKKTSTAILWYTNPAAPTQYINYGIPSDAVVPADYNGDGKTDIAVWRPSTGIWYVRGISKTQWGVKGDIPVPGDYNGDGKADLAIWRPSTGTWWVRGIETVQWGEKGDVPVPGDYNGDGKTDLAVYRPSNHTLYVRGIATLSLGTSGEIPVPGDYNGDGKTDIAMYSPSLGMWYIDTTLKSNTYTWAQWGSSLDQPAPADFTGDGTTDLAVFWPGGNTYYIKHYVNFKPTGTTPLALPYSIGHAYFPTRY